MTGTLDALRHAAAADPTVRYVSFTRNFGHEPRCVRVCGMRTVMPSS